MPTIHNIETKYSAHVSIRLYVSKLLSGGECLPVVCVLVVREMSVFNTRMHMS